jgi:hypothetical protein
LSNNLNLAQVTATQTSKFATINQQSGELDAAITEVLDTDYTSASKTLSLVEYRQHFVFRSTNLTVARNLNLELVKKFSMIDNTAGTAALSVIRGSTTIVVPAGRKILIYTDGTANGLEEASTSPFGSSKDIWIPAELLIASTGTPALGTAALTAGQPQVRSMDFDQTTAEEAQFAMVMPEDWDLGTITATFIWSHPTGGTAFGVTWGLRAVSIANDGAIDVAFGTQQIIADTGGTTDDQYIATTPAITVGGTPAAGDMVYFEVERLTGDAGDTLDLDARLQGVRINYTAL